MDRSSRDAYYLYISGITGLAFLLGLMPLVTSPYLCQALSPLPSPVSVAFSSLAFRLMKAGVQWRFFGPAVDLLFE